MPSFDSQLLVSWLPASIALAQSGEAGNQKTMKNSRGHVDARIRIESRSLAIAPGFLASEFSRLDPMSAHARSYALVSKATAISIT
jgi:hypothetical protein